MSTGSIHPDFRIGFGSLLVFVAVVAGMLLGYPFVAAFALLVGASLVITGKTKTRLSELLAAIK